MTDSNKQMSQAEKPECYAPMPLTSGVSVKQIAFFWRCVFLLLVFCIVAGGIYLHAGNYYEVNTITLDFHESNHYGGYARSAIEAPGGLIPFHRESVDLMDSSQRLLSRDPDLTASFNADRLWASSFLTGMIHYASFQRIDLVTSVLIRNAILWLMAIWGAFELAKLWSRDELAGWITALLVAAIPTFALTFDSFKGQVAGVSVFLVAAVIHDRWLVTLTGKSRFLAMTGFWFTLLLGSGAWLFFLIYVCVTRLFPQPRHKIAELKNIFLPFLVASLWKVFIYKTYTMKSATSVYNIPEMMLGSISWFFTFITGGDVREEYISAWSGYKFFTEMISLLAEATFWTNPVLLAILLMSLFLGKRTIALALIGFIMFLPSHLPNIVSGWTWHYGYCTAAFMAIFSICAGWFIAAGFRARNWLIKGVMPLLLGGILAWYLIPVQMQHDLFYGFTGRMTTYDRVFVYFGEESAPARSYGWPEWTRWEKDLPGYRYRPGE